MEVYRVVANDTRTVLPNEVAIGCVPDGKRFSDFLGQDVEFRLLFGGAVDDVVVERQDEMLAVFDPVRSDQA